MSTTSQQQQPDSQQGLSTSPSNEILRISPQQFHFTASRVSPGQVSKVKLKNLSSSPVGYKFKTNAPMKYSVKPVLGVLAPDESIKIFVRCDNWISPQDRFLLQCIVLKDDEEAKSIDSRSWKSLDPKRFIECYIPCVSVSPLSIRDPEDDTGSLSSSSATSSSTTTTISPPLQAIDLSRLPPQRSRQQVFERWQYSESMRPTVVSIGGVGRRLSNSSAASTTSAASTSPGIYPTLFTPINTPRGSMDYHFPASPTASDSGHGSSSGRSSKRNSVSLNPSTFQSGPNLITSTIAEEPVSTESPNYSPNNNNNNKSLLSSSSSPGAIISPMASPPSSLSTETAVVGRKVLEKLGLSEAHALEAQSRIMLLWQYTRGRILVLSLVCLFFGVVLPLARSSSHWVAAGSLFA
ncbi:PapD-like protein [Linnemannia elongata]|nr:PapD-like protein [Linnemannia elongata]